MAFYEPIKPCPHCGCEAFLTARYSPKIKGWFVFVQCEECKSQGRTFTNWTDPAADDWNTNACLFAIDAWNMRVASDRLHD